MGALAFLGERKGPVILGKSNDFGLYGVCGVHGGAGIEGDLLPVATPGLPWQEHLGNQLYHPVLLKNS